MVDMSRLPNLSRCRTISRVPFGIRHCGTVIAPKTHRATLRRLNQPRDLTTTANTTVSLVNQSFSRR